MFPTSNTKAPRPKMRNNPDMGMKHVHHWSNMMKEPSENKDEKVNEPIETRLNDSFEKKRQRLLQKVELAKKGWTGLGAMQNPVYLEIPQNPENSGKLENLSVQNSENPVNPAEPEDLDTTPYEEIDDDSFEESRREPIGILPSFISLNTNTNEEEEEFEERLI